MKTVRKHSEGFTLIELSIVLVIIGLIVGGVLVGQDLIRAAEVRAQITQIEGYNRAANTFRGKYGFLPGDIPATPANQFGFIPRNTGPGQGDGNFVIEGWSGPNSWGWVEQGETVVFWVDLSQAQMLDGSFATASFFSGIGTVTGTGINAYLPPAKIGKGNYVYVWSGGYTHYNGLNYFGLSLVSALGTINGCGSCVGAGTSIPVAQAYALDKKMDDGLPQSGNVQAMYLNATVGGSNGDAWAAGNEVMGATSSAVAASGTSSTCYDNGGVAGSPLQYSLQSSGGSNPNCALSFQFQ